MFLERLTAVANVAVAGETQAYADRQLWAVAGRHPHVRAGAGTKHGRFSSSAGRYQRYSSEGRF